MKKITLQNRKGQDVVGILEKPENGTIAGTVVIEHGYGGFKEQKHILAMRDTFLENGFITFNFDATNTFGESDGDFEKATLGLHTEDFEDVTEWAQEQNWFAGPLAITGHSMGGVCMRTVRGNISGESLFLSPYRSSSIGTIILGCSPRIQV